MLPGIFTAWPGRHARAAFRRQTAGIDRPAAKGRRGERRWAPAIFWLQSADQRGGGGADHRSDNQDGGGRRPGGMSLREALAAANPAFPPAASYAGMNTAARR